MAERYQSVYKSTDNLYMDGSPIIISARALLKDNQTNQVLAQLKFQSVSNQQISALTVELICLDTAGRCLGTPVNHRYLDLNVKIGDVFGSNIPIIIPDSATRSFSVRITEVIFVDGSLWTATDTSWETLHKQEVLSLRNPEWDKQYRIQYGSNSNFMLLKQKDLWHCACGAINKEGCCYSCGMSLSKLDAFDLNALKAAAEIRLEEERKTVQIRAEEDAKRRNKVKKLAIIFAIALCSFIVLSLVLDRIVIPTVKYNKAVAYIENGNYNDAYLTLSSIREYKDAALILNDFKPIWDKQVSKFIHGTGSWSTVRTYDEEGTLIEEVYEDDNVRRTSTYDENGNVVKVVHSDGDEHLYEYDKYGNKTKRVSHYSDGSGDTDYWTHEYDKYGNIIKTTYINPPDSISNGWADEYEYEYEYYTDGKIKKKISYDRFGDPTEYEYEYDESGNITTESQTWKIFTTNYKYEYDDAGKLIKETISKRSVAQEETTYEYDEYGNLTKKLTTDLKTNRITNGIEYTYYGCRVLYIPQSTQ